jgi:RimJ/RimL family protein N-acetyltransferase
MRYPEDVPTLTDGVVTLRGHREADVEAVLEQCLDPLSQTWTTVPIPYTRDLARRFVREAMPGGWALDREWAFAVDVDGEFCGTVSLRDAGDRRAEVAYGSHPRIRGTGGMLRAVRLLLEWGFAERDLATVVWWANRGNFASRRLAWRLGFTIESALPGWLPQRGELLDAWGGTLLAGQPMLPRHPWIERPTIESPRLPLRLRGLREDDTDRLVEGCRDEVTAHWLGEVPRPFGADQAAEYLLATGERMASGGALHLAVADVADDRLLGVVAVSGISPVLLAGELGFWTHPAERGRGVATEAARLVVRHAQVPLDEGGLGLARLTALAGTGNEASAAVLERAGLRRTGTLARASLTATGLVDATLYATSDL